MDTREIDKRSSLPPGEYIFYFKRFWGFKPDTYKEVERLIQWLYSPAYILNVNSITQAGFRDELEVIILSASVKTVEATSERVPRNLLERANLAMARFDRHRLLDKIIQVRTVPSRPPTPGHIPGPMPGPIPGPIPTPDPLIDGVRPVGDFPVLLVGLGVLLWLLNKK